MEVSIRSTGILVILLVPVLKGGCAGIPRREMGATDLKLSASTVLRLERISTVTPFPRGLALLDNRLYVVSRGRVRGAGGVSAIVEDRAGTIFAVDPEIAEPAGNSNISDTIRNNGTEFAVPSSPPFHLWDRTSIPPEADRLTDRPYCTLRYHGPSHSFYVCAFSGIDKHQRPGKLSFSKNLADAILRYDLRTSLWYEVERHNLEAGSAYPHHDTRYNAPPHGWLSGPDNCLPIKRWLYAVAKDNNRLVVYDLQPLTADPDGGPPQSALVLEDLIYVEGYGDRTVYGHSALAHRDNYLYIAFRTTSEIIRIPLERSGLPARPIRAELVARFAPYDPQSGLSANLTDMAFDSRGRLYVVSALPAKIYRFMPNPDRVFDARLGKVSPWADLASLTGNASMKCENLVIDEADRVYVSSGDGYDFQALAYGTVYRLSEID